jgi:hypothetical protein
MKICIMYASTSDENRSTSDKNRSTSDTNRSTSDKNRSTSDKNRSTSDKNRFTSDKNRMCVLKPHTRFMRLAHFRVQGTGNGFERLRRCGSQGLPKVEVEVATLRVRAAEGSGVKNEGFGVRVLEG